MNKNTLSVEVDDQETTLLELREIVRHFVDERKWQSFHDPKNLSMSIAIEAAELMEHFQWLTSEELSQPGSFDKSAASEELADVLCYTLALANALDIDVSSAVSAKMAKNRIKYPLDKPFIPNKRP